MKRNIQDRMSISDSEVTETKKALQDAVSGIGAEIKSQGDTHFIDLAYEMVKKIKSKNIKFDQAHFGWIKFTATGEQATMLEKELKKLESVLRTLVIKTVEDDAVTDLYVSEEVVEDEVDVNEGVDMGEGSEESTEEAESTEEKAKSEEVSEEQVEESTDQASDVEEAAPEAEEGTEEKEEK